MMTDEDLEEVRPFPSSMIFDDEVHEQRRKQVRRTYPPQADPVKLHLAIPSMSIKEIAGACKMPYSTAYGRIKRAEAKARGVPMVNGRPRFKEKIIDMLTAEASMTYREIAQHLGCSVSVVGSYAKQLRKAGWRNK